MKTVNLEEILEKNGFDYEKFKLENPYSAANLFLSMHEACNQTLALAAEEQAKYYSEIGFTSTGKKINDSILNLKQQII